MSFMNLSGRSRLHVVVGCALALSGAAACQERKPDVQVDESLVVDSVLADGDSVKLAVSSSPPRYWIVCSERLGVQGLEPGQGEWERLRMQGVTGNWYLDGDYVPEQRHLGCDTITCERLRSVTFSRRRAERVGYAPAADTDAPRPIRGALDPDLVVPDLPGDAGASDLVPVYETRRLTGRVRVTDRAYTDPQCAGQPHDFELIVDIGDSTTLPPPDAGP